MDPPEPLLRVHQLSIRFESDADDAQAGAPAAAARAGLDGVSFDVPRATIVALVGDSGSGKSLTALSILGLLPPGARVESGQVLFEGRDLLAASEAERKAVRGRGIAMIFQEPATALSAAHTVGWQLAMALRASGQLRPLGLLESLRRAGRAPARELLAQVELPEPERLLDLYPHQLSAGMRRRVMIAMALACRPSLLIADEPTTGLDAPIQAQILDLLGRMATASPGCSVLFITHDLCVAAEVASEIVVLYAGQVVEAGPVRSVLGRPQHPYTIGLLENIPGHGPASPPSQRGRGASPERGCRYAEHCAQRRSDPGRFLRCANESPLLEPAEARHRSRCFYPRLAES